VCGEIESDQPVASLDELNVSQTTGSAAKDIVDVAVLAEKLLPV
jgi:hypothetical protein